MSGKITLQVKDGGLGVVLPNPQGNGHRDGFVFGGYASTFGNLDGVGDVVRRGAYTQSLRERPVVPVLWQHDAHEPIGKTTLLVEDEYGLLFKGRLDDTPVP